LYTLHLSTLYVCHNSPESILRKENGIGDAKGALCSSSCSLEKAHAQDVDDFPDGGLRAWLVVLGVSS
jgi:hypothetical protein